MKNNNEYVLLDFKTMYKHTSNMKKIIVTICIKFSYYISRHEI